MKLYQLLTKKHDDLLLYEENVLNDSGRLTEEGRNLVIDLLFQGKEIIEIKKIMLEEIKRERKENK